jgi:peptide/nickel transport system permease protein
VLVVVAAVAAPVLAPHDPEATDLDHVLSGPTGTHPLGTDSLGRDVLTRLMYGGQVSLAGVAVAVLTMLVLGVVTGLLAGFLSGWVDRIASWIIDLALSIPVIITLLVVLSVVGSNETAAMITVGVLSAPSLARVVRGATMAVKQETFVAAARVAGLPSTRIITGQVLPRVTGPIIVQTAIGAGGALIAQAGIEFLGLGVQPPTPTWGGMITDAAQVVDQQAWLLVPTGLVVGLTVLAFGLLGDAVRDATADRVTSAAPPARRRRAAPPSTQEEPAPGALLALRGVTVALPTSHGTHTVVDGVDLDIRPGETVGLVGESGCGKSITGRAILGLLPRGGELTAGTVHLAGENLTAGGRQAYRAARGSRVALISQEHIGGLDPVAPVGRQVAELVRRHRGCSRGAARIRTLELLESVRLPEPAQLARRYPHELSGGMAQRVAIAMALAGDPELLIADEPTTALDVTVQAEILGLLHRLQAERGMAILLISHDLGVIAEVCHRAYVMYAGRIVESGPGAELFRTPRHPYTAGLVGCSPQRMPPRTPLAAIPGMVPEPWARPAGCHFHPRCPLATAACESGEIPMAEPAAGRHTRCLHHTELTEEDDHARAGVLARD